MALLFRKKKKDKRPSPWRGGGVQNPLWPGEAIGLFINWVRESILEIPNAIAKAQNLPATNFKLAETLFMRGEYADALMRYKFVTRLQPDNAEAWFKMARCYHILNNLPDAIDGYKEALQLQPAHASARFMLVVLKVIDEPLVAVPLVLVEEHFTQLAKEYESAYVEQTDYHGHREAEIVLKPYLEAREAKEGSVLERLDILDIGCGTGLAGVRLRPWARRLVGVDICQAMMDQVPKTIPSYPILYDQLIRGEAGAYLSSQAAKTVDVINASGMLNYNGDLSTIFTGASTMLRDGGAFLFSIEKLPDSVEAEISLIPGIARFGHKRHYIEALAQQHGFRVHMVREIHLYQATPGYQFLCVKQG